MDSPLIYDDISEAYDVLDPNGNITVIWDIKTWTSNGYIVCNFQSSLFVQLTVLFHVG